MKTYIAGELPAKLERIRLSEEENRKARMRYVRGTADIFLICDGELVLVWRKSEPMSNQWWRIGGGLNVGETFEEAAARNLKRETSLEFSPDEFHFFDEGLYIMPVIDPLGDYWCADYCRCYALNLILADVEKLKLDPKEYEQKVSLFSPKEILEMVEEGKLHESFRQAVLALDKEDLL